jgi:hypothetical protein
MADVKISQLPAATTPVAGTEVLPIVQSGVTAKVAISSLLSAPNPGNVSFSGTGNRITGDFSNATVANRVMFQSSTVNGFTSLEAITNGTGVFTGFLALNSSDPANASTTGLQVNATESQISASRRGTGTFLPMTFYTGGSERLRIATTGGVSVGSSTDPGAGALSATGGITVTGAAGLGYGTGSGGTVTQATSKSTTVTLNNPTGRITMNNAALAALTSVDFTLINTSVTTNDTIICVGAFISVDPINYKIEVMRIADFQVLIRVTNTTVASRSEALQIQFTVIKGAIS